ncbi:MAG: preprotein translocase subunit SecG [Candidatus Kerfeldbacteria bacterium]|nr:preprotein translocase subunit SecG [Candidatus Kerfeldbacteria bacterium]
MQQTLNIATLVLAILLITFILLQARGAGLGSAFGGESSVYTSRRGAEKILFYLTIGTAVLFFGTAAARLFL